MLGANGTANKSKTHIIDGDSNKLDLEFYSTKASRCCIRWRSWQSATSSFSSASKLMKCTGRAAGAGFLRGELCERKQTEMIFGRLCVAPQSFVLPSLFSSSVDLADCSFALGCFAAIKIRSWHRSLFSPPASTFPPFINIFSFLPLPASLPDRFSPSWLASRSWLRNVTPPSALFALFQAKTPEYQYPAPILNSRHSYHFVFWVWIFTLNDECTYFIGWRI